MKDKKIIFMGTPLFSVPILEGLIQNYNVVLVVSMKDKLVGRKQVLTPSEVKKVALENNIEVFTPNKIREEYQYIKEFNPDLIITAAYGGILPKELLDLPKYGCINVHASLLPKYRGANPIMEVILNGEEETGISIMYMDEQMDTGDIIKQEKIKIEETDTKTSLENKLSLLGKDLILEVLPSIFNQTNNREKQNQENASYTKKLTREDELLDFSKTSKEVLNKIRALKDEPLGYFILNQRVIKVKEAFLSEFKEGEVGTISNIYKDSIGIMCSDREILITRIIPSGKQEMKVSDFLNGIKKEEILGRKL